MFAVMSEACCRGSRDFRKASAERRLGTGGDKPRPYGMAGSVFVGAAFMAARRAVEIPARLPPNAAWARAGINPAPTAWPEACS